MNVRYFFPLSLFLLTFPVLKITASADLDGEAERNAGLGSHAGVAFSFPSELCRLLFYFCLCVYGKSIWYFVFFGLFETYGLIIIDTRHYYCFNNHNPCYSYSCNCLLFESSLPISSLPVYFFVIHISYSILCNGINKTPIPHKHKLIPLLHQVLRPSDTHTEYTRPLNLFVESTPRQQHKWRTSGRLITPILTRGLRIVIARRSFSILSRECNNWSTL